MGSGVSKERLKAASSSGIFVASGCGFRSWKKIEKAMTAMGQLRGVALDRNKLTKPAPLSLMRLNIWSTLRTLDLSFNGLKCACVLGGLGACKRSTDHAGFQGEAQPTYLLEVLNLSGNSLSQLPPLLLYKFPKLRRLLCRDNKIPLDITGGLFLRIGAGVNLGTIDLGRCALREFSLLDDVSEVMPAEGGPFPSLCELMLDGNRIGGTFSLLSERWAQSGDVRFARLKNVNLAAQQAELRRVDPSVYTVAPFINVISLAENAQQDAIMDDLRQSDEYKLWCERHKDAVTRQLRFTGRATLL